MPGWSEANKGIIIKVTELQLVFEDWSKKFECNWNIYYADVEEPEEAKTDEPKAPVVTPIVPIVPSVPTDKDQDLKESSSKDSEN